MTGIREQGTGNSRSCFPTACGWLAWLDVSYLFSAKQWRNAKIRAIVGADKFFVINEWGDIKNSNMFVFSKLRKKREGEGVDFLFRALFLLAGGNRVVGLKVLGHGFAPGYLGISICTFIVRRTGEITCKGDERFRDNSSVCNRCEEESTGDWPGAERLNPDSEFHSNVTTAK